MSARLIRDMDTEAARCVNLASGYAMGGELRLKSRAMTAACHLALAVKALSELEAAQGEQVSAEAEA